MLSDRDLAELTASGAPPRVGVYICHCGTNIAHTIDVASVAAWASELPGVVLARDYKYMCSDPGQALIQADIEEHRLNRVVVAACSPCLHEKTFRNAIAGAGLSPYFFQMVNVREQAAWVHTDRARATEKARDLIRAAVRRVARHRPLEPRRAEIDPKVLVVGGGIAGIQAALTAANAGKQVYLVERQPSIGGHMAQFDKTFPTLDCAACILTPKMTEVKTHPNITLWTYSEVDSVEGYVGNWSVTVRHKPRYVIEELCVGCSECVEACVYKTGRVDNEFDLGLSKRKPVYLPFPQAVPPVAVIDPETCIDFKTGKCKKTCVEACGDRHAIDLTQKETSDTVQVGAIIVTTGFETFDAKRVPEYGWGRFPGVYTSLELERLVNASGPTNGEIRLRDGRTPKSVGILHCIGSRDENTNRHCSRVCCMASLKLAHLVREHTDAEVWEFYIDMRTPGKDFEEFYQRIAGEGVHLIRGKVARVEASLETEGMLELDVEDTLAGLVRRIPVDMVVLAVGLQARADAEEVRRTFHIGCGSSGFFQERHPKLAPVSTTTDGVFIAGCCQGPKDIPDTVAQATAAAGEALALIDRGFVELEPNTAHVVAEECSGCKTCLSVCPYGAISRDEEKAVAVINEVLCKGCGTCVAVCPSGSIVQNLFEDAMVFDEIQGVMSHV